MESDLIHDDGRLVGTRVNVYSLMPYFLDPTLTEAEIARLDGVTPEQVAAARAYVLHHPDEVLAQHLKIEARIARGNPPEVVEQMERSRALFAEFRDWVAARREEGDLPDPGPGLTQAWRASREPSLTERS